MKIVRLHPSHQIRIKTVHIITRTSAHYYKNSLLSRFHMAICPGFGTGIRPPGQKRWRLLSRVVEPGQNVPRAKKYLRPVGLEPKTYCLAHGLLANSPK